MKRFIIKRHGNNAANQSMKLVKVLGTVDSTCARGEAAKRWSCYK